jgi:hypothetical protein
VKRDIDFKIYFLNSFRFKLYLIIIAIIEASIHIKLLVCN